MFWLRLYIIIQNWSGKFRNVWRKKTHSFIIFSSAQQCLGHAWQFGRRPIGCATAVWSEILRDFVLKFFFWYLKYYYYIICCTQIHFFYHILFMHDASHKGIEPPTILTATNLQRHITAASMLQQQLYSILLKCPPKKKTLIKQFLYIIGGTLFKHFDRKHFFEYYSILPLKTWFLTQKMLLTNTKDGFDHMCDLSYFFGQVGTI